MTVPSIRVKNSNQGEVEAQKALHFNNRKTMFKAQGDIGKQTRDLSFPIPPSQGIKPVSVAKNASLQLALSAVKVEVLDSIKGDVRPLKCKCGRNSRTTNIGKMTPSSLYQGQKNHHLGGVTKTGSGKNLCLV